jgi:hypothetical protein
MTWLQIYTLIAPLLVVLFALGIVALTRWQDKREARRRAEGKPPVWGIDYL